MRRLKKFLPLAFFIVAVSFESSPKICAYARREPIDVEMKKGATPEEQLTYIDRQIDSLTDLRNYYDAKAWRYRNQAERLQFQNNLPEAQRMFAQSDEFEKIVDKIDGEIEKLELQRNQIQRDLRKKRS